MFAFSEVFIKGLREVLRSQTLQANPGWIVKRGVDVLMFVTLRTKNRSFHLIVISADWQKNRYY